MRQTSDVGHARRQAARLEPLPDPQIRPTGHQLPEPGHKQGVPGEPPRIGMREDGRTIQYHSAQHAQTATHSRKVQPEDRRPERAKPVTAAYRRPPDADDAA